MLQLLVARLFSKTPKFFTVIKWVAFACALITGIPQILADQGIILPIYIGEIVNKAVALASAVAAIIAQMTVQDTNQLPKSPSK